jgi:large subunit ribosomal protein L18
MIMLKRRRLQKTDYGQRLVLLKSGKIRLVVRRKHNNVHVQFVHYEVRGDRTLVEEISHNLAKYGWKMHCGSIPAAYLTGLLAGKKALQKTITGCVADIGLHAANSSVLYAAVKGVADAGVDVPFGFALLEDRINGSHIASYAKLLKKDNKKYGKQFSSYIKAGADPENIVQHFEEVKANILKNFPEKRRIEA